MQAWSFDNLVVLVNGVPLTGFGDGDDVVSVKRRTASATDKVGADGKMMVSISTDKSGEVVVKLQQTSDANAYLSNLVAEQEFLGSFFLPVTLRVQDLARQDLATGAAGYIMKPSDLARGKAAGDQEWTIVVEELNLVFGGLLN